MFTTVVVCGLVLIVALWGFSYWCVYRAGKENGYDQAHAELEAAKVAVLETARKTGRHARTQPRTAPVRNPDTGTWHLPIPGPSKPQAGRTSEPGTVTFGKVDAGVTGPIAKLVADNEAWNAQQAVEDEIFRLGLALD